MKEWTIFSPRYTRRISDEYYMKKIDEKIFLKTIWYFTQGNALGSGGVPKISTRLKGNWGWGTYFGKAPHSSPRVVLPYT